VIAEATLEPDINDWLGKVYELLSELPREMLITQLIYVFRDAYATPEERLQAMNNLYTIVNAYKVLQGFEDIDGFEEDEQQRIKEVMERVAARET